MHKKIEMKKNDYSSDRYNQNNSYYNDRYRNNDRYRSNRTVEITHKIIIDRIHDKDIIIDLKARINLDLDMSTTIKEALHPDLTIDHHIETTPIIDTILDQDIDIVLNHKETPLDDIITRIDLHPDQEITDHDLEHLHKTDNKIE